MNVPLHLREDAASVATEGALKALTRWKPGKGMAQESFAILGMRYAIRSFMERELSRHEVYATPEPPVLAPGYQYTWSEVREALATLGEASRTLLTMTALGYPMMDISRRLRMFGPNIAAAQTAARAELMEALA